MKLLRVEVPKFRALENVVIDFEPDFYPQVFPLGSLNGGGKSTLLQLIFVLLHCFDKTENLYFQNIIFDIKKSDEKINRLALITLLTSKGIVSLEYLYGDQQAVENYRNQYRNVDNPPYFSGGNIFQGVFFAEIMTFIDKPLQKINDGSVDNRVSQVIKEIKENIFLISPSNQPYLFLSREERRALFSSNNKSQYDQAVKNAQKNQNLPNFFMFDFIDVLVDVFRKARANDFKERNKNNPFAHTEKLEAEINSFFIDGKKITSLIIEQQRHTQDEIQGMCFKLSSGETIYTEDLSDGELKRLAIYTIIKNYKIQNSIVLFDEIENGFHPRWQRYIVDDLVEWGASNQYILATHSYEVCRNVTFEHIKELPPKLFPENQE